jgi:hypothetical protein
MRGKPILILIVVAVILVVILSLSFGQEISSTSSPHNKYTVQISQERRFPGIERYIYLNASRSGEPFLRSKLLYTGDFLDQEFNSLYPNHSWLSESILKIGRGEGAQSDALQIWNNTSYRLKYLLIETYEDKFVLLDVAPGAIEKLDFDYVGRLSCQGEFSESSKRFGVAVELPNEGANGARRQFLINVKGDGASIESPQQTLNHVACCAVDRPDFCHE